MGSPALLVAIVDDDDGVRRSLHRLVRALGHEPVLFASGEAFLASRSARPPGVVVLDLHLPGLNGIEILERLRDLSPALPVIVTTGFDEPGTRERCLAAGAAAYITKPIEAAVLRAAISGARR